MKTDISQVLVDEHKLILRMIGLLEKNAPETAVGRYLNWQFYRDGIDFIRSADRFHHAKEEDVLFKALIDNGMPKENSPVAAMLMEHDQGRGYVRSMEIAMQEAQAGRTDACRVIAANFLAYAALLRDHIDKEDTILYPLAERVIPETMRAGIQEGYQAAATQVAERFAGQYAAVVAKYEIEV
jgi:hemerythrin-like domain-containing protein